MAYSEAKFYEFILKYKVMGFVEKPLTLKSGRQSHWYVNWRTITSDCYLLDELTSMMVDYIKELNSPIDCVYGVPEGATKTALLTAYKLAKQSPDFQIGSHVLSMGRAREKKHGDPADKYFVGAPKGNILLLEDVTTTGQSLLDEGLKLKSLGYSIGAVLSLTHRMERTESGHTVADEIAQKLGKEVAFYSMSQATKLLPLAAMKYGLNDKVIKQVTEHFKLYGEKPIEWF